MLWAVAILPDPIKQNTKKWWLKLFKNKNQNHLFCSTIITVFVIYLEFNIPCCLSWIFYVFVNSFFDFRTEESLSASSTTTLTHQEGTSSDQLQASENQISVHSQQSSPRTLTRSSTHTSEKDKSNEKDDIKQLPGKEGRRLSNVSNATLTNVSVLSELYSKSDPVEYYFLFIRDSALCTNALDKYFKHNNRS